MNNDVNNMDLFQSIFRSSVEGILAVDADGVIIQANPASEQMFAYDRGELIGKQVEYLIPEKFKRNHESHRTNYIKNPKARRMGRDFNLWGLKKDGSQFPIEMSLSPTTIGKRMVVVALISDISEKKAIEKELIQNKDRLINYTQELEKKVVERTKELTNTVQELVASNLSLEDLVLVAEEAENRAISNKLLLSNIAQHFPRGIVTVVDSNFNIVLIEGGDLDEIGLKEAVIAGMVIDEITAFSEVRKKMLKDYIQRTLRGEHLSFEIEYKTRPYLVHTTPLYNQQNEITQALLVYSNISKQKQAEKEILKALKKEQELSELKSRFLSVASHEFRTPLSGILSSAILIEKQNGPGKEEKRIEYVSKIRANIKNLIVILNDFLSMSKLDEGKIVSHPAYFDLITFSKSLIDEMEITKKKGQEIILKHQVPNLKVNLDPKFLRHIVFNLLSNAIKYSPENTEIIFEITVEDSQLIIAVIDKGIGISKEDQTNIFQRFYRANNALHIQGTGLGLNIVKQYIELMGGAIDFTSELNRGSTFYIKFFLEDIKNEKNTHHRRQSRSSREYRRPT